MMACQRCPGTMSPLGTYNFVETQTVERWDHVYLDEGFWTWTELYGCNQCEARCLMDAAGYMLEFMNSETAAPESFEDDRGKWEGIR